MYNFFTLNIANRKYGECLNTRAMEIFLISSEIARRVEMLSKLISILRTQQKPRGEEINDIHGIMNSMSDNSISRINTFKSVDKIENLIDKWKNTCDDEKQLYQKRWIIMGGTRDS
jgi:hypothetical protein